MNTSQRKLLAIGGATVGLIFLLGALLVTFQSAMDNADKRDEARAEVTSLENELRDVKKDLDIEKSRAKVFEQENVAYEDMMFYVFEALTHCAEVPERQFNETVFEVCDELIMGAEQLEKDLPERSDSESDGSSS